MRRSMGHNVACPVARRARLQLAVVALTVVAAASLAQPAVAAQQQQQQPWGAAPYVGGVRYAMPPVTTSPPGIFVERRAEPRPAYLEGGPMPAAYGAPMPAAPYYGAPMPAPYYLQQQQPYYLPQQQYAAYYGAPQQQRQPVQQQQQQQPATVNYGSAQVLLPQPLAQTQQLPPQPQPPQLPPQQQYALPPVDIAGDGELVGAAVADARAAAAAAVSNAVAATQQREADAAAPVAATAAAAGVSSKYVYAGPAAAALGVRAPVRRSGAVSRTRAGASHGGAASEAPMAAHVTAVWAVTDLSDAPRVLREWAPESKLIDATAQATGLPHDQVEAPVVASVSFGIRVSGAKLSTIPSASAAGVRAAFAELAGGYEPSLIGVGPTPGAAASAAIRPLLHLGGGGAGAGAGAGTVAAAAGHARRLLQAPKKTAAAMAAEAASPTGVGAAAGGAAGGEGEWADQAYVTFTGLALSSVSALVRAVEARCRGPAGSTLLPDECTATLRQALIAAGVPMDAGALSASIVADFKLALTVHFSLGVTAQQVGSGHAELARRWLALESSVAGVLAASGLAALSEGRLTLLSAPDVAFTAAGAEALYAAGGAALAHAAGGGGAAADAGALRAAASKRKRDAVIGGSVGAVVGALLLVASALAAWRVTVWHKARRAAAAGAKATSDDSPFSGDSAVVAELSGVVAPPAKTEAPAAADHESAPDAGNNKNNNNNGATHAVPIASHATAVHESDGDSDWGTASPAAASRGGGDVESGGNGSGSSGSSAASVSADADYASAGSRDAEGGGSSGASSGDDADALAAREARREAERAAQRRADAEMRKYVAARRREAGAAGAAARWTHGGALAAPNGGGDGVDAADGQSLEQAVVRAVPLRPVHLSRSIAAGADAAAPVQPPAQACEPEWAREWRERRRATVAGSGAPAPAHALAPPPAAVLAPLAAAQRPNPFAATLAGPKLSDDPSAGATAAGAEGAVSQLTRDSVVVSVVPGGGYIAHRSPSP